METKRSKLLIAVWGVLALLFFEQTARGQTPTPEPNNGVTVTAGISYTLLTNGPSNSVNVTKLDVAMPVSDRFSLIYNQYIIPSAQANVFIGGVRYSRLASQLFPKAKSKLDLTKFRIYGDVGAGSRRDSISNARVGAAVAVSGGFSYNPVANVSISLEGGYMRTGRVASSTNNFLFGTSPMIAPGVKLTF